MGEDYKEWLEEFELKDCKETREAYTTGDWEDMYSYWVIKEEDI